MTFRPRFTECAQCGQPGERYNPPGDEFWSHLKHPEDGHDFQPMLAPEPTVQPGQVAVTRIIHEMTCVTFVGNGACDHNGHDNWSDLLANAVLSLLHGKTEREVAEAAWDQAATAFPQVTRDMVSRPSVRRWLLDNNPHRAQRRANQSVEGS